MADSLKILGQINPSATTLTDLYVVPGSTSTAVSSLVVCNRSSSATTFRVSVAQAGAADSLLQYLYYDVSVMGNSSFVATIGITLASTDKIRCYAGAATLTFSVFGVEVI